MISALGVALAGCAQASGPVSHPTGPVTTSSCPAGQDRPQVGWHGPNALTGVQFVTPERGWVVGLSQIMATTDGGAHWIVQDSGKLQLTSVDFVDSHHGWAVGADSLLATSDGGAHWTALAEPCPSIRQVHFVSPLAGFAIAGGTELAGFDFPTVPQRGGVVLTTTDGGHTWRRLPSPPRAQSVCFNATSNGWLGAGGALYRTMDGGRSWVPTAARVRPLNPAYSAYMLVQCAGSDSAWALAVGPGAASSQEPHVGFHADQGGAMPIFAEQYFPHPGIRVTVNSPGSYAGPLSVISPAIAAFVDFCPACGWGTAPWALVTADGATIIRKGNVSGLNVAVAASFVSPRVGWVVGMLTRSGSRGGSRSYPRIVSTADGGRTWHVDYQGKP